MPGYNVFSSNINKKSKLVYANSPEEAAGRYRERYKIGDNEQVYPVLRSGAGTVQEVTDVAATVHSAATSVFIRLKEAERYNDVPLKQRLAVVLALMNSAYSGLFTYADNLDAEVYAAAQNIISEKTTRTRRRTRRTEKEKKAS